MAAPSSPLEAAHASAVGPWIALVDGLREHGVGRDVALPQIAVMGDQSSGKSSVLEALSGVPFPRGSGVTTRCPTEVQLRAAPPGAAWRATVRASSQAASAAAAVADPAALGAAITEVQDALTTGRGVSGFGDQSIVVHVTSPDVPDLTLIDLPGIVRTTTHGQARAVIAQVDAMLAHYLAQPRTVILAVVPAAQDVATVDILERAAAADPSGQRTVGVLTKPDLVDEGGESEVLAVLRNVRKPLRLGCVWVGSAACRVALCGAVLRCVCVCARRRLSLTLLPSAPPPPATPWSSAARRRTSTRA